jgi:GT2 family glycosyltransferase
VQEGPIDGGMQCLADVTTPEQYECTERTHEWKIENVNTLIKMRNFLLNFARAGQYDYYFMCDSDLVLHPKTLVNLIEAQKDIIAECIWTRWTPEDIEAPSAWDFDVYSFIGSAEERMAQFREPGLYRIGMSGACILMSKAVIQSNVCYDPVYNVTFWGEDRYFSLRAACNGFEIWLDTHYKPIHLYRQSELNKYVENGGYKAAF